MVKPRSVGTHDGTFHADEVTACALLILFDLIDEDKIHRTRDPKILDSCQYVCDVGGIYDPSIKRFDHHQVDYQGPLSSAGMILEYLRDQNHITEREYHFFNNSIIRGVDDHDNGRDPQVSGVCTYSHLISNFMPINYAATDAEFDAAFHEALHFALDHFTRLWKRYQYTQKSREIVEAVMQRDTECLMFEKAIPWLELFFELGGEHHPAKFIIMPSQNHWKLRGVPPSFKERMKVRVPLPEEWAGLLDEELKQVSKIPGAIFCHKGRFISVWETREDAIKALQSVQSKMRSAHDNDLRKNYSG